VGDKNQSSFVIIIRGFGAFSANSFGDVLVNQQGCQIFKLSIPKREITIKYTKRPQNRPNGNKIYQPLPLQTPPKFTNENIPSGNPVNQCYYKFWHKIQGRVLR
jgi:hypothetical protein